MRGHEEIVKLRMLGVTPAVVVVNDHPCPTDWPKWGETATVCIFDDGIENIDFRFAKGLTLNICAANKTRAAALFELGKGSGAKVVACGSDDGFNEIWRG
jgi:hypothetical protein